MLTLRGSLGPRTIFRRIPIIIAPVPTKLLVQSQLLEGAYNATLSHIHVVYSIFSALPGFENDVARIGIGQRSTPTPLVTAVQAGPGRIVAVPDGNTDIRVFDADPSKDAFARLTLNALKWVSELSPVWSLPSCLASGAEFPLRQLGAVAPGSYGLLDDGEGGKKMRRSHAGFGLKCVDIRHAYNELTGKAASDVAVTESGAILMRLDSMTPMMASVLHGYVASGGGLVLRGPWQWNDAAAAFLARYGLQRTYTYRTAAVLATMPDALPWSAACGLNDPVSDDAAFQLGELPTLRQAPTLRSARHHVVAFWPQHRTVDGSLHITSAAGHVPRGLFRITRFPSAGSVQLDAVSGEYQYRPSFVGGFAENDFFTWTVDGVNDEATVGITGYHPVLTTTRRDWYQVPYTPRHTAARIPAPVVGDARIERVLVAQTHLQEPNDPLQALIGNRTLAVKVDVSSASGVAPPDVLVEVTSSGGTFGPHAAVPPTLLPAHVDFINQNVSEAYWLNVPGHIVQPGVLLTVTLGSDVRSFNFTVVGGAHLRMFNTEAQMWGTNFMKMLSPDAGQEFLAKAPAATLDFTYVQGWHFDFIVPNPTKTGPAECNAEVLNSTYVCKLSTGGYTLIGSFIDLATTMRNVAGVYQSGQPWLGQHPPSGGGLGGGRRATGDVSYGVYFHEVGHGWGRPHSVDDPNWPHREVCGAGCVGNTSAYDPIHDMIIPARRLGDPEQYKNDPMQGGAAYARDEDFYSMHADWNNYQNMKSIRRNPMRYGNRWHEWDSDASAWGPSGMTVGGQLPRADNVTAHMFVGWVRSDDRATLLLNQPVRLAASLMDVLDPTDPRGSTASGDYTLRITWGLPDGTHMVEHRLVPRARSSEGPIVISRESRGELVRAELLLTPSAMVSGLPLAPQVLHAYHNPVAITGPAILLNNTDFQHIATPLHLPRHLADGSRVTWGSSAPRWLNAKTGRITRPSAREGDKAVRLNALAVTPYGEARRFTIRAVISAFPAATAGNRAAAVAQTVAVQIERGLNSKAPPAFLKLHVATLWRVLICSNSSAVSPASGTVTGVRVLQPQAHTEPVAVNVRVVHRFTGQVASAAATVRIAPVSHSVRMQRWAYHGVAEVQLSTSVSRLQLTESQHADRPAVPLKGENGKLYGAIGWYGRGAMVAFGRESAASALARDPTDDGTSRHVVQALEVATMYAPDTRNLAALRRVAGAALPILSFHHNVDPHPRTGLTLQHMSTPTPAEVDALDAETQPIILINRALGDGDLVSALQRFAWRGGVVFLSHQVWNLDSANKELLNTLFSVAGFEFGSWYSDVFGSTGGAVPASRRPTLIPSALPAVAPRRLRCPAGLMLNVHAAGGDAACISSVDAPVSLPSSAFVGQFRPVQDDGSALEDDSGNRIQRAADGRWQVVDSRGAELLQQVGPSRRTGPLCGGALEAPVQFGSASAAPALRKASVVEIVQHENQPLQMAELTFDVLDATGSEVRLNKTAFTCYIAPFSHWSWYNGESDGRAPLVQDGDTGTNTEASKAGDLSARLMCVLDEPAVVVRAELDSHVWWRARELEVRLGDGKGPVGHPLRRMWVYEDQPGSLQAVTAMQLTAVGETGSIAGVVCRAWNGTAVSSDLPQSSPWAVPAGTVAISCELPHKHRVQQVAFTSSGSFGASVQLSQAWGSSTFRVADGGAESYAISAPAAGTHELFTWTADGEGMVSVFATTDVFNCGGYCQKDLPRVPAPAALGLHAVRCARSVVEDTCGAELTQVCRGETSMAGATFALESAFNRTAWQLQHAPRCIAFQGATASQTAEYPVSGAVVAAALAKCKQNTAHAPLAATSSVAAPITCAARVRAGRPAQCSFDTAAALPTTSTLRIVAVYENSFVSGRITGQSGATVSLRLTLPGSGVWQVQAVDLMGSRLDIGSLLVSALPLRNATRSECSVFNSDVEVGERGGPAVTAPFRAPVAAPGRYVPAPAAAMCSGVAAAVAAEAPPSRPWSCDPLANAASLLDNAMDVVETLTLRGGAPVVAGSLRRFSQELLSSLNATSAAVRRRAEAALDGAGANGTAEGFPDLALVKAHPINDGSFSPERCALKSRLADSWARTAQQVSESLTQRSCASGAGTGGRALSVAADVSSCAAWADALMIVLNNTMPSLDDVTAEVSDAAAFVALDGLTAGYASTAEFLQQYSESCLNSTASAVQSVNMPCVQPCDAADTTSGCLRQCTAAERAQAVADLYCFSEPCPVKTTHLLDWPACAAAPLGQGFECVGSDGIAYPLEACASQPSLAQQAAACIAPTPSPSGTASATPSISGTPDATMPTASPSVTPSFTPSHSPTADVTPSGTVTPSVTPSSSVTPSATVTAPATPPTTGGGGGGGGPTSQATPEASPASPPLDGGEENQGGTGASASGTDASSGPGTGAVIGISVAAVALVALVAYGLYVYFGKRAGSAYSASPQQTTIIPSEQAAPNFEMLSPIKTAAGAGGSAV